MTLTPVRFLSNQGHFECQTIHFNLKTYYIHLIFGYSLHTAQLNSIKKLRVSMIYISITICYFVAIIKLLKCSCLNFVF